MHGIDLGNMECGMYAHRCREFKLNCCRTGDSLSFTGSSVAWGELVGEWLEGNVPSSESFFGLECTLKWVLLVLICVATAFSTIS